MRKNKKNDVTNWRNDKKDIFAILGDNKKFLMPAILIVAVGITIFIALSANKRATQVAQSTTATSEVSSYEVPDVSMEENAYPEVNALVEKYYEASAEGDADTLSQLYKGLDETEILKSVAASDYIEKFEDITVYTKPGPVEGSYVAYVYNDVKLYDYDGLVPGLETLYICTDDSGNLYINGDIADANELEYLKQINVQGDVIDLNNKVASNYNEMVSADENLAELLTKMRSGLQVSVGEALATSEGASNDAAAEASSEEEKDSGKETITTRIIKATDVINIRSSDSETADIIDKTQQGAEYKELEALANGWSRIEYKGSVAYVKTEFFDIVSEETIVVEKPEEESEDAANAASSEETDASSAASSAASTGDSSSAASSAASSASSTAASTASSSTASSTAASSAASSASSTQTTGKVDSSAFTGKTVVEQSIKFRKEQSTDSDSICTIYAGATVNVIEQYSNGWAKVEYNKSTGYIKSEFLRVP